MMSAKSLGRGAVSILLLGSVGLLGGAGCDSGTDCTPGTEDFEVDRDLTEAEVAAMVEDWGVSDRSELECQQVCRSIYEADSGWEFSDLNACTFGVEGDPGPDPDSIVGTVSCRGIGQEYGCE